MHPSPRPFSGFLVSWLADFCRLQTSHSHNKVTCQMQPKPIWIRLGNSKNQCKKLKDSPATATLNAKNMDNVIFLSSIPSRIYPIPIYWARRFPLPDVIMIKYPRAILLAPFLWFMTLNMANKTASICVFWDWGAGIWRLGEGGVAGQ